ncbi:MAG: L-ribulose-5-phosphate 3-epimerase [Erysipelotrichaceae bacterium]|nr:L-ribulose-5-phosphate 3-epimerase [Erysipelotrichaceae bacterium]
MVKNNNYLLGMYEKSMPNTLSIKEKLLFVKEAGFDHLEISIDESDEKLNRLNWSDEEIKTIRLAIIETGVPIITMCLSGHRKYPLGSLDSNISQRSLEIMQKAITLAAKLGIRIIQLAGYDVYYEEGSQATKNKFIENLKIASEMAAKESILMGFETMETSFMDTVEKAMEYVKLIDSPYLQIFPDIGNLTNAEKIYGVGVVDDLKKGQGHLIAAHLKETIPNHYREITFGTGHTDYINDLMELKKQGVRLFTGEFWYTGQENWQDICKEAASFLRDKLDRVF